VDNFAISPEGVQNAAKLTFNGVNSWKASPSMSLTQQTYTASVWLKVEDGGGDISGWLSMYATGTGAVRQDVSITITSEWQRFEAVFDSWTLGAGLVYLVIRSNTDGRSCLAYGAQLEAGSYPTSYIPNHSGGSVTRGVDLATGAGDASTFNDSEGVLYTEIAALAEDSDSKRITISDGTLANRITISISSNTISGFINVNNVTEYTFFESGQDVVDPIKIAVKYKINDFALWINGTEYDVSSSGNTFSSGALSQLSFDNASAANNFYGNVKQVLYFPEALSDTDLATLTTL
jgi:hypothetical protein